MTAQPTLSSHGAEIPIAGFGTSPLTGDVTPENVALVSRICEELDGIRLESLADLRANKLTCLLSRSEPRDLVDLCFLDRAGFAPERDLPLAQRKDAGIDPGVLAWLLGQFPVAPLPLMLEPLSSQELDAFRAALAERFRKSAIPGPPSRG